MTHNAMIPVNIRVDGIPLDEVDRDYCDRGATGIGVPAGVGWSAANGASLTAASTALFLRRLGDL